MAEAEYRHAGTTLDYTPDAGMSKGEVTQVKDGRAAVATNDIASGVLGTVDVAGVFRMEKTSGIVFLDGGDAWWDHSANKVHFRPVDDRDFKLGTFVGDWASGATLCEVALNQEGRYLIDLARDGFLTAIVGTQAISSTGLQLLRRGGCHNFLFSSVNEAQKLDALSVAGFAPGANAIVEAVFAVPNDGGGSATDFSIGVASGTHATDADSIAEHLFCHLDGNSTNINFQSKDGTTTVAAADSTYDYTEGSGTSNLVHVWFDMRDPASVKIYVNGIRVLSGSTFNVNAAVGPWKLLAHGEKTAAADVYELALHTLRARIAQM